MASIFLPQLSLEAHKSHQQAAARILKTGQWVGPAASNSLLTFAELLLLKLLLQLFNFPPQHYQLLYCYYCYHLIVSFCWNGGRRMH